MNATIDEVKNRLSIEDLVSSYTQLKKVGRNYKALCPFHSEKTPSFIVSPEKGIAYCFGCHKGGDIFKFFQEIERIDFKEALNILADRAGVKLELFEKKTSLDRDKKEHFFEMHELAMKFFEELLWSKKSENALKYLLDRGLTKETIRLFHLGYSPDSYHELSSFLQQKGFQKKELVEAGLALSKNVESDNVYDRFRGRIMFPIFNTNERVIAFGGRSLSSDVEPKYLNSPETPLYHKSNVLYGFSFSKTNVREEKKAIIVEGYMDAIMAYQSGAKCVVASSGTALTHQQLHLLKPFIETLILAFDMDDAGQDALKRAFDLSREFDFETKVLVLPEGKDIADYCLLHAKELLKLIQNTKSYGEYFLQKLIQIHGKDHYASKQKILRDFAPFFFQLKSNLEKDFYIRQLAFELQLSEKKINNDMHLFKSSFEPSANYPETFLGTSQSHKNLTTEEWLLGFLIEYQSFSPNYLTHIDSSFFSDDVKTIYFAFCDYYNGKAQKGKEAFLAFLSRDLNQKAALLALFAGEFYGELNVNSFESILKELTGKLKKEKLAERRSNLQLKINEAERSGNKILSNQFLQELCQLHE